MSDFDDLDDLEDAVKEQEGEHEVSVDELLTDSFMRKNTDVESIDAFFDASPWEVETEDDLEAIPEQEMDQYVRKRTRFQNWDEMLGTAGEEWTARQLGL